MADSGLAFSFVPVFAESGFDWAQAFSATID